MATEKVCGVRNHVEYEKDECAQVSGKTSAGFETYKYLLVGTEGIWLSVCGYHQCPRGSNGNHMKKQQNGVCDMDCNYERFNFDGGECCDPDITDVTKTCFDPDSPHR